MFDDGASKGGGFSDVEMISNRMGRDASAEVRPKGLEQVSVERAFIMQQVGDDPGANRATDSGRHRPKGCPLPLSAARREKAGLDRY
jgi:hypothetical protein